MTTGRVAILGIFVADLNFLASRMPAVGETLIGSGFAIGPGGKGSNQAVAAARAGAGVSFISRLAHDPFGELALTMWKAEGINPRVIETKTPTGAAFIYIHESRGDNAVLVVPGAAGELSAADVDAAADAIRGAGVFVTQLEQPAAAAARGLAIAREAGAITVFNPAPAGPFDDALYALSDYVVPNESEAQALTGIAVTDLDGARRAGDALLAKGAGTALITLGERGSLFHTQTRSVHIPPVSAGAVVATVGAGDAFVGSFAAALARGEDPLDAARFGAAAAGISVTRPGAATAMPHRAETEALLRAQAKT
ncbi:ribokinase [Bradyrhizobium sp. U87765 SZCCT0131]|uniref:ribokinase n=1 Tax=unclassified Bradyrhizobium TaxID=2631580 RepID=UPI001BA50746|nr:MULTISPECIES: ribokinase [unclassified Bradyrhizobium]MBR1222801.1 ribokinase [Bradyrhizobium sp. U87765 SZCCT0131]MBR1265118.1 ribokinase [Bradyrhizobium sp. U87765 SZCCT0134]MBR1303103.1 ribokinase [Bradyrhizobium sp. U87765 SZCCT0110]MBR1318709.1 ribokinase [Bradyrhizobium sp. U87765 SZCCT0109]MBR1347032.1 ribokinase [Bradyrhizobium sp. U87765 SZCCT0048]